MHLELGQQLGLRYPQDELADAGPGVARPRRPGLHGPDYIHLMDEGLGDAGFLDGV